MSILKFSSQKENVCDAVNEIKKGFSGGDSKMILYFASSLYSPGVVASEMKAAFPETRLFGCTTAGELISGYMLKNSIVAMSFSSEEVEDVEVKVIENIGERDNVKEAFVGFDSYYGEPVKTMDIEKYVGIVLIDGMSGAEEKVMDRIGDLTNVTMIGGSAGDDLKFKETYVFADGEAYTNAAVVALMKIRNGFDVIKTQSFEEMDVQLRATKVDESNRVVLEFDGHPAAEAYARAINVDVGELEGHFMEHPVGLMVNGEPYVRSPQRLNGKAVCFYCQVKEGMNLSLLKSMDIVSDTKKAVADAKARLGNISAIVNFHCILRTLELEDKNQTKEYGEIFSDIPMIGFSTYGEEYIGHVNQTSTMLVFK